MCPCLFEQLMGIVIGTFISMSESSPLSVFYIVANIDIGLGIDQHPDQFTVANRLEERSEAMLQPHSQSPRTLF